ncbi:hypothetical protein [Stenotrophomonas sp.]|uniref:hypothetical protein n=1 Tax=Stenotrophomonas sp. TaxID=69392 RepID=UPI0028AE9FC1|nr:hypothetical protein [Stenotrophomonas sp.]
MKMKFGILALSMLVVSACSEKAPEKQNAEENAAVTEAAADLNPGQAEVAKAEIDLGGVVLKIPGINRNSVAASSAGKFSKANVEYDGSVDKAGLVSDITAQLESSGFNVRYDENRSQIRASKDNSVVMVLIKSRDELENTAFKLEGAGGLVSFAWGEQVK